MIGVDIIRIDRFESITIADYHWWQRVYTAKEWNYAFSKPLPKQHLAGFFAAKEAFLKSSDVSIGLVYRLIEVCHTKTGRPWLRVLVWPHPEVYVSISHEQNFAIAVVTVAEKTK
ncbi:MAG: holo-ACP synthase [Patescibacteria group bacterium]